MHISRKCVLSFVTTKSTLEETVSQSTVTLTATITITVIVTATLTVFDNCYSCSGNRSKHVCCVGRAAVEQ